MQGAKGQVNAKHETILVYLNHINGAPLHLSGGNMHLIKEIYSDLVQ